MPLCALYARDLGASSVEVGLMATAFLLASFVVTPAMGWLADHLGAHTVLGLSLLTYAELLVAYVPITSPSTLLVLRALEDVSAAGVLTPARALMNTVRSRGPYPSPSTRQARRPKLQASCGLLVACKAA
jgi:MFS family permease